MKYFYEVIRGDGPVRLEPCESSAHAGELITFDKPIPDGRVMVSNTFGNLSDELINMPFSPLKKGQVFVVSFSDTLKRTSDRLFADDNSTRNHEVAMDVEKTKQVEADSAVTVEREKTIQKEIDLEILRLQCAMK
jgi:hypothetical protein